MPYLHIRYMLPALEANALRNHPVMHQPKKPRALDDWHRGPGPSEDRTSPSVDGAVLLAAVGRRASVAKPQMVLLAGD